MAGKGKISGRIRINLGDQYSWMMLHYGPALVMILLHRHKRVSGAHRIIGKLVQRDSLSLSPEADTTGRKDMMESCDIMPSRLARITKSVGVVIG